jgi:hypothetical protein
MRSKYALAMGAVLALATTAIAGPPAGAIFTTTANGSRVNANLYDAKTDVYLDGGPGAQAPAGAAGLDEGWYYFQVTEPAGKVLLSTDPIENRRFHVNAQGVIDQVATHVTGIDQDHGALTVQLFPYLDTPNSGGEYKAWVTPIARYQPDSGSFGFVGKFSKTDNFKVRNPGTPDCGCP